MSSDTVVADNLCDTDTVIVEDAPIFGLVLCCRVFKVFVPSFDGVKILPGRDRNKSATVGDALEPLNTDEAFDLFQVLAQYPGEFKVAILKRGVGLEFKQYDDHDRSLGMRVPWVFRYSAISGGERLTPTGYGTAATTAQYQLPATHVSSGLVADLEPVGHKPVVRDPGGDAP